MYDILDVVMIPEVDQFLLNTFPILKNIKETLCPMQMGMLT